MGITGRVKAALRTMVFGAGSRGWWSAFVGRPRIDLSEIGDGTSNSIVAATLGWIARNFVEAPVRVRERAEDGTLVVSDDPGAIRMLDLLRRPNPHYAGHTLWMATIIDYWVSGNATWVKVRGGPGGAVTELWWVPWSTMTPRWPMDGSEFISYWEYRPGGAVIRLAPEDVIHFRFGIDPDNVRIGRSPLTTVLREVFTDEEAGRFSAALLRNLGIPGVIISPDTPEGFIGEAEAEAIKLAFRERFGGERRGEPMVTSGRVGVNVLSFSPEQMDLKSLRRVPEERISAIFGVPAVVVGFGAGLDRSTFANFSQAREVAWEENIVPVQRLLSAQLELQLLPEFVADPERYAVDFDVSQVRALQEDQNAIWERARAAAASGLITVAAFKQAVGLPVGETDRVYLRPFNSIAVPEDAPPDVQGNGAGAAGDGMAPGGMASAPEGWASIVRTSGWDGVVEELMGDGRGRAT